MDVRSQFTARYKKDLSTEAFRAKVARRKSLTQKENRHNAFRKSRRLALTDVNFSPVKEGDVSILDDVFTKKEKVGLAQQRIDQLRRFKEEKQLRKLKEQRENAKRGIFKCGKYKHDAPLPSFPQTQHAMHVKPEKSAPPSETKSSLPSETRVTRSMARSIDQIVKTSRLPHSVVNSAIASNKGNVDRQVRHMPATSMASRKQTEKENLVMHTRTTRVPFATATRPVLNVSIAAPAKPILKSSTSNCPERRTAPNEKNKVSSIKEEKLEMPKNVQPAFTSSKTTMEKGNAPEKKMRERSFAPQNFQFKPLEGVSTILFKPVTPRSADAFLNPCYNWSPAKVAPRKITTSIMEAAGDAPVCSLSQPPVESLCSEDVDSLNSTKEEFSSEKQQLVVPVAALPELSVPQTTSEAAMADKEFSRLEEIKHDVPYFRDVLRTEIERLTLRCLQWDQSNDMQIPEDAKALIRTTVGQSRLLMAERFKQFEGLVDDCEFKRGEKETTCSDLDGFWDMINFQIEDVLKKFADLCKLRDNNWQQENLQAKKVKRKIVPAATAKPSTTAKPSNWDDARAAARNRLASIKAAMKNKIKQEDALPDLQATKDVNTVVFDAGFFKVESPAKSVQRSSCKTHQSRLSQCIGAKQQMSRSKLPNLHTAEQLSDPQTSPNDLSATVKKVLFGSTDDIQSIAKEDDVCPMVEDVNPAAIPSTVNVADIEASLLEKGRCSSAPGQSLEPNAFKVATENLDVDDMEAPDEPKTQDIEMCSPEKNIEPSQSFTMAEEPEIFQNDADCITRSTSLDACCDALDFLKSATPSNLTKLQPSPLETTRFAPAVTSDLIVFSPAPL